MMARLHWCATMEPCLLALDTSTDRMAVGLYAKGAGRTVCEAGGALASARLLPAVLTLLERAGLRIDALDAIGFGHGPGAFTGLRTACAVAQGLAFGLGRPVLALDSLLLVADDARVQQPDATAGALHWVAMDARMDEVYAAAYRWHGSAPAAGQVGHAGAAQAGWQTIEPPRLYTLAALAAAWRRVPPQRVSGSALQAFGGRLPLGAAQCVAHEQDRAGALLRLARRAWADAATIDPAQALPLYLRDKVALSSAERAAARALSSARVASGVGP